MGRLPYTVTICHPAKCAMQMTGETVRQVYLLAISWAHGQAPTASRRIMHQQACWAMSLAKHAWPDNEQLTLISCVQPM